MPKPLTAEEIMSVLRADPFPAKAFNNVNIHDQSTWTPETVEYNRLREIQDRNENAALARAVADIGVASFAPGIPLIAGLGKLTPLLQAAAKAGGTDLAISGVQDLFRGGLGDPPADPFRQALDTAVLAGGAELGGRAAWNAGDFIKSKLFGRWVDNLPKPETQEFGIFQGLEGASPTNPRYAATGASSKQSLTEQGTRLNDQIKGLFEDFNEATKKFKQSKQTHAQWLKGKIDYDAAQKKYITDRADWQQNYDKAANASAAKKWGSWIQRDPELAKLGKVDTYTKLPPKYQREIDKEVLQATGPAPTAPKKPSNYDIEPSVLPEPVKTTLNLEDRVKVWDDVFETPDNTRYYLNEFKNRKEGQQVIREAYVDWLLQKTRGGTTANPKDLIDVRPIVQQLKSPDSPASVLLGENGRKSLIEFFEAAKNMNPSTAKRSGRFLRNFLGTSVIFAVGNIIKEGSIMNPGTLIAAGAALPASVMVEVGTDALLKNLFKNPETARRLVKVTAGSDEARFLGKALFAGLKGAQVKLIYDMNKGNGEGNVTQKVRVEQAPNGKPALIPDGPPIRQHSKEEIESDPRVKLIDEYEIE